MSESSSTAAGDLANVCAYTSLPAFFGLKVCTSARKKLLAYGLKPRRSFPSALPAAFTPACGLYPSFLEWISSPRLAAAAGGGVGCGGWAFLAQVGERRRPLRSCCWKSKMTGRVAQGRSRCGLGLASGTDLKPKARKGRSLRWQSALGARCAALAAAGLLGFWFGGCAGRTRANTRTARPSKRDTASSLDGPDILNVAEALRCWGLRAGASALGPPRWGLPRLLWACRARRVSYRWPPRWAGRPACWLRAWLGKEQRRPAHGRPAPRMAAPPRALPCRTRAWPPPPRAWPPRPALLTAAPRMALAPAREP